MIHRVKKFLGLSFADQLLLLRCWCMLGWYWSALKRKPFKALTRGLERIPGTQHPLTLDPALQAEAGHLGAMVARAAAYTPWRSRCLVQVIVLQRLLQARGISGQFYLGADIIGTGEGAERNLEAHAWLRCGDTIVNGARDYERYAPTWAFRW